MRVLHVVTGLQKASGVTTFVENVVRVSSELGHTVDVVTQMDVIPPLAGCDIIHIHGLWSLWLHKVARKACRLARSGGANRPRIVWSTHGMTAPWSLGHKWWKKCLYWLLIQKPDLKRAVLIHSTVEKERAWNAALGFKRHIVVPLGTHLPEKFDSPAARTSSCRTLLFVGRIYPVKALDRLIEAFAKVKGEGWKLRIVGPDQAGHQADLVRLCENLNASNVEFAGPKFAAELDREYAACDCLALVSHTENFGATVVDAMAHGKPVVTSTNTPWQEVVERKCGWWVGNEPDVLAKALREMMSFSDEARAEMGARGRQLVEEKYSWRAVAERLVVAYQQVLATPG